MQFLNPIWLFGIAGMLIPIFIHLWNVRPGKVLKVGSILLMGESSRQNSRSFKLQDIWLLLIRCMIVLFISLILAEPVFKLKPISRLNGLILIPPAQAGEAYGNYQKEIDSLLERGFEFRLFSPGFEKAELPDYLKIQNLDSLENVSYKSLIKEFLYQNPEAREIRIYTDRFLKNLEGERVPLPKGLIWRTFPSKSSGREWIHSAWFSHSDSIRALIARSDSLSTVFRFLESGRSGPNARFKLEVQNGKPRISFKDPTADADSHSVQVDTGRIRIGLYANDYPGDLIYLKSALEAIREFTRSQIDLQVIRGQQIPIDLDFLFWLSNRNVPPGVSGTTTVFRYATGEESEVSDNMLFAAQRRFDGKGIPLFRRIKDPSPLQGIGIWEDAAGNFILKKVQNSGNTSFVFFSRFNPSWNNLVWTSQFPEMMLDLLIPERDHAVDRNDLRTVHQDLIAGYTEKGLPDLSLTSDKVIRSPMNNFLVLILLILICSERWIAHTKLKDQNG